MIDKSRKTLIIPTYIILMEYIIVKILIDKNNNLVIIFLTEILK